MLWLFVGVRGLRFLQATDEANDEEADSMPWWRSLVFLALVGVQSSGHESSVESQSLSPNATKSDGQIPGPNPKKNSVQSHHALRSETATYVQRTALITHVSDSEQFSCCCTCMYHTCIHRQRAQTISDYKYRFLPTHRRFLLTSKPR